MDDDIKASRMLQSHNSEPKDDEEKDEEAEHLVKHDSVESASTFFHSSIQLVSVQPTPIFNVDVCLSFNCVYLAIIARGMK